MDVETLTGLPYAAGTLLDVHRPADVHDAATVLLWHGSGPDERDVMAPVARAAAARGLVVVAPAPNDGAPASRRRSRSAADPRAAGARHRGREGGIGRRS